MSVCPICQKPIEITDKNMGALFNCPHCRAVYFIGWDGKPEIAQHDPEPEPEPAPIQETIIHVPTKKKDPTFGVPTNNASSDFVVDGLIEGGGFSTEAEPEDVPPAEDQPAGLGFDLLVDPSSEANEASGNYDEHGETANAFLNAHLNPDGTPPEGNAPPEESPAQEPPAESVADSAFDTKDFQNPQPPPGEPEQAYNFDEPLGTAPPSSGLPNPAADNFNDVTDFANSEQANGPLTYFVAIRGLELAETFARLKEALTDSRFGWDADEVVSQSNNGELILRRLNPTKAAILVSRIKDLPIELSWHQEVYGDLS